VHKLPFRAGILLILFLAVLSCGCFWDSPAPRPAGTDGGLLWAHAIALPQAKSSLDTDALLVEANGFSLLPDGRLPANMGRWELRFASYTKGNKITITVNEKGVVSRGPVAPSDAIFILGNPPGVFPDSMAAFTATGGKGAAGTRTVRDPARLYYDKNRASYIWSIPLTVNNKNEVHLVRWDGIYIEME
jgi:hypothetical protein